ncbi:hypothetical protein T4E_6841 [Trichinella pseudospiralis]|uniref:Uncharacterized protein n=1 Tax=Trichinella pseudospiralis TaxID=6337 RepID=A0A0V0YHP3_TRIPS|nr:hypothetical protein T4E_6841 [Trichinella pseudospiralis]
MDRRSSLTLSKSASVYTMSAFSVRLDTTFRVLQVSEDTLNCSPMRLSRIVRKMTDNPHRVANV